MYIYIYVRNWSEIMICRVCLVFFAYFSGVHGLVAAQRGAASATLFFQSVRAQRFARFSSWLNGLAGVVRGHVAAKQAGVRYVVGARLDLVRDVAGYEVKPLDADQRLRMPDGISLLAYPTDRPAYSRLSRLISLGRRRAPKGACWLSLDDVREYAEGLIFALLPDSIPPDLDPDALAHGESARPDRA